jgi:hypothetical protein
LPFIHFFSFRSLADVVLKKDKNFLAQKEDEKKKKQASQSYFSWNYWVANPSKEEEENLPNFQLNDDELKDLYNTIDFDVTKAPSNVVAPKEVFHIFMFNKFLVCKNPISSLTEKWKNPIVDQKRCKEFAFSFSHFGLFRSCFTIIFARRNIVDRILHLTFLIKF